MRQQSEQIGELMKALSLAQGKIKNAIKDSNNPFFKSKYADLASVKEACQEALTAQGLSVVQTTDITESGAVVLVTTLGHSSGQFMQGVYPLNPKANDPQGTGSALTYARRYALAAIVGVATEDDDGESAQGRNTPSQANFNTYQATDNHKTLLLDEIKKKGLSLTKEQLGKLSEKLVKGNVSLDDLSKHI